MELETSSTETQISVSLYTCTAREEYLHSMAQKPPSFSSPPHGDEPQPSLWTSHMYRLYGILALGYLCIVFQGYDGSLMPSINAMVGHKIGGMRDFVQCLRFFFPSRSCCWLPASISALFWNVSIPFRSESSRSTDLSGVQEALLGLQLV